MTTLEHGGADDRPGLLFLCHRIPYPPNKGDKIRSFHLLRHLSESHAIHLGAFVDDPEDWRHAGALDAFCASVRLVPLDPRRAKLRSLSGLLSGDPLTLPYYRDREMATWVAATLAREKVERAVVYSSAMAQYLLGPDHARLRRVIDFVDVDSDKWLQYAGTKAWPMSWLFRREGRTLLAFDRRVAAAFDHSLFVSSAEAALFRRLAPEAADRVGHYNNGVDVEAFSPDRGWPSPFGEGELPILFTGAMDYWPNEDAVAWFAEQVLPRVRERFPTARFYIVGSNPTERVAALARLESVTVTGRVHQVQPYLAHARVVVAPMHIARGIQNKVLEGMAMARPVVASSKGIEGIDAVIGEEVLVADGADAFTAAVEAVLDGRHAFMGKRARQRIAADFTWDNALPVVDRLLEIERASGSDAMRAETPGSAA